MSAINQVEKGLHISPYFTEESGSYHKSNLNPYYINKIKTYQSK
jgi:hypothetical protein